MTKLSTIICACGVSTGFGGTSLAQTTTATVIADADTFIWAEAPNNVIGFQQYTWVRGGVQTLLRFPLTGVSLPSAQAVRSAALELSISHLGGGDIAEPRDVRVHPLRIAGWDEDATWNCPSEFMPWSDPPHCSPLWTSSRDDALNVVTTSTPVVGLQCGEVVRFDVTADVRAAFAHSSTVGWILSTEQESWVKFASRETPAPPRLLIEYENYSEIPVFGGQFVAPDTPEYSGLGLAPRGDGTYTVVSSDDGELIVDPNLRDPITAATDCFRLISACVQPGARNYAGCFANVRHCTTAQPWLESEACCPAACSARYQELRGTIENESDAAIRAVFYAPSCMPGHDEFLGEE